MNKRGTNKVREKKIRGRNKVRARIGAPLESERAQGEGGEEEVWLSGV